MLGRAEVAGRSSRVTGLPKHTPKRLRLYLALGFGQQKGAQVQERC